MLLKVPSSAAVPAPSLPFSPCPTPLSQVPASLQGRRRVPCLALPLAAVTGSAILRLPDWRLSICQTHPIVPQSPRASVWPATVKKWRDNPTLQVPLTLIY